MKTPRFCLAALAAVSLLALRALAADPTGTWRWSVNGPDGSPLETTLKLEFKDGKLAGLYSNQFGDAQIRNATFKDEVVAFEVEREFDGNKFVVKCHGKLEGDSIKGTLELPAMDGGDPRKVDWDAKRTK